MTRALNAYHTNRSACPFIPTSTLRKTCLNCRNVRNTKSVNLNSQLNQSALCWYRLQQYIEYDCYGVLGPCYKHFFNDACAAMHLNAISLNDMSRIGMTKAQRSHYRHFSSHNPALQTVHGTKKKHAFALTLRFVHKWFLLSECAIRKNA